MLVVTNKNLEQLFQSQHYTDTKIAIIFLLLRSQWASHTILLPTWHLAIQFYELARARENMFGIIGLSFSK